MRFQLIMKTKNTPLILFLLTYNLSINAQDRVTIRDKFNWKEYHANSTVDKDSINYNALQGNWIAYEGCSIGDYIVGWKTDNNPKIIQIKGDTYRKTLAGDFYSFRVDKNLIILETGNQPDSAFINLITDKELTITYKCNSDYEQYFYKR